MICEAIRSKPKQINTRLGTFGEVAYALAPKAVDQILHMAYKVFPDSAAAKGEKDPQREGLDGADRDGEPDEGRALVGPSTGGSFTHHRQQPEYVAPQAGTPPCRRTEEAMKHTRSGSVALATATALLGLASPAVASPAQSPPAVAGSPSCGGLIVASFNHNTIGPSGNPTASAGPGSFFGPATRDAIRYIARLPNCGV